jgi:hypothetical protein
VVYVHLRILLDCRILHILPDGSRGYSRTSLSGRFTFDLTFTEQSKIIILVNVLRLSDNVNKTGRLFSTLFSKSTIPQQRKGSTETEPHTPKYLEPSLQYPGDPQPT